MTEIDKGKGVSNLVKRTILKIKERFKWLRA